MEDLLKLKKQLLSKANEVLEGKSEEISQAIRVAKESRDGETKSSAGDKYETGRAMMHIEIENNEMQLNNILQLKKTLKKIQLQQAHQVVQLGSLIKTNLGNYFVSVAIGKIEVNHEMYYSISLSSPIGKEFQGKNMGDEVKINGNTYKISLLV